MNNTQFRRLLLDTPTAPKSKENSMASKIQARGATPALGSRMTSNIPMTPYCNPNHATNSLLQVTCDQRFKLT